MSGSRLAGYRWLFWPIGAIAFVLGLYDFGLRLPGWQHWPGALISTLQLYVLNVPAEQLHGWAGRIAALLAPIAAGGAVITAFGERFDDWRALRWLRIRPATDVFIGGGDTAAGLAIHRHRVLALGSAGGKLVEIDPAEESALARAMESFTLPSIVHRADALSVGALEALQLHRTGNVWITTGDDFRNLEIARRVRDAIVRAGPAAAATPTRLLVSVRDRHLTRAKLTLFPDDGANRVATEVEFFSLARLAARALLTGRRYSARPAPGRENTHLLIIGAGEFAASLAVSAIQQLVHHPEPAHCLRISLIGLGVEALRRHLESRFPVLAPSACDPALDSLLPLAQLHTFEVDPSDLMPMDWRRLQQTQPFDTIYVASDRDVTTLSAALRAVALRDLTASGGAADPVIVECLHQAEGSLCALPASSSAAQAQALQAPIAELYRFNVFEGCIRQGEAYPGEQQDHRAKLVHSAYKRMWGTPGGGDAERQAAPDGPDSEQIIDREWAAERSEDFRWSSRMAADHIDIKLDFMARRLAASQPESARARVLADWRARLHLDAPSAPQGLETLAQLRAGLAEARPVLLADLAEAALQDESLRHELARLEHRRFVVERLLEGWLPTPSPTAAPVQPPSALSTDQQKRRLRLNPTLAPFDTLTVAQRYPNFEIVAALPRILRAEQSRAG